MRNDPRNGFQPEQEDIMPLIDHPVVDKYGIAIQDYAARVEKTVRDNITGVDRIIGTIETNSYMNIERMYWEMHYIVAFERNHEYYDSEIDMLIPDYGTIKCIINNEGQSMLTTGHYGKTQNDALIDMIHRSMFDLRFGVALLAELTEAYRHSNGR